jgi:hypothetical protein
MAQQAFTRPSLASSAQTTKLATLLLLVLLLLSCSAPAAAKRRRRGANSELNNPANPNSKSYHSLYNGPGNGNAGGSGNGQGNGLDGNPGMLNKHVHDPNAFASNTLDKQNCYIIVLQGQRGR